MYFLGIDTSCYTTSVAVVGEEGSILADLRIPLIVGNQARGLRQSEMVFQHLKNLPGIFPREYSGFKAVAASVKPRPVEGSYMPVFRVAEGFGEVVARSCGAAFYALTHQHAHIAAALLGQEADMGTFLALHVSGGTTDVLSAQVERGLVRKIGSLGEASDITAGQLIDRIGVKLGLPFPAGPGMSVWAEMGSPDFLKAGTAGLSASFSGAETAALHMIEKGMRQEDVAASVLECVARTLGILILRGREQIKEERTLLFGGVLASPYIRNYLGKHIKTGLFFAEPRYASDNACGLARQALYIFQRTQEEVTCWQA